MTRAFSPLELAQLRHDHSAAIRLGACGACCLPVTTILARSDSELALEGFGKSEFVPIARVFGERLESGVRFREQPCSDGHTPACEVGEWRRRRRARRPSTGALALGGCFSARVPRPHRRAQAPTPLDSRPARRGRRRGATRQRGRGRCHRIRGVRPRARSREVRSRTAARCGAPGRAGRWITSGSVSSSG
jgi:hypothetical protein